MASDRADLLRRVFSTDHEAPPACTELDAIRPQRAPICNIGRGTCGTVYELGATNRALKLGTSAADLLRDYRQTIKAESALREWAVPLVAHFAARGLRISMPKIPRCLDFHSDCADTVSKYEEMVASDETCSTASLAVSEIDAKERAKPGFIMERIPAIPHCARKALIHMCFDDQDQQYFLDNMDSVDCLLRLYFGQEDDGDAMSDLRNFPLCTDQMDAIGLDTKTLVTELAVGLAVVHWGAELDAMDSEYVLSSSLPNFHKSHHSSLDLPVGDASDSSSDDACTRRVTHVWILDFDKASPLDLEESSELVRQLVVATTGNDPYFPRPDLNKARWLQFKEAYLEASGVILTARVARGDLKPSLTRLPKKFMSALHKHYMSDTDRQGDFILFTD